MNINKNITEYLEKSAKYNNSIILITDRDKILYSSNNPDIFKSLDISYIEHMNNMNSKNIVLEVYNEYKFKIIEQEKIRNQSIALILDKNIIIGSLIILNHTLDFECKNYIFMSTLLRTLKLMLKDKE